MGKLSKARQIQVFNFDFEFFVWSLIWVIFIIYVIVKRYSKILENSFLKKGILDGVPVVGGF